MAKFKKKGSGKPEASVTAAEEAAAEELSLTNEEAEVSEEELSVEPVAQSDEDVASVEALLAEIATEKAAADNAEITETGAEAETVPETSAEIDGNTDSGDAEAAADIEASAEECDAEATQEESSDEASLEADNAAEAADESVDDSPVEETDDDGDDSPAEKPMTVKDTIFAAISEKKDSTAIKNTLGELMDTCESVIVAVFVVLLIFTYLFSIAVVQGDSMLPTLRADDRLLLLNFSSPEPGDVVVLESRFAYVFDSEGSLKESEGLGKKIVKRLIATENQVVDIDFSTGIVYVDGVALEEPYTMTLTTRDEGAFQYPITVPEGYVFVLGDNRSVSKDSRHPDVGLIPEDDIVGKVWLRVYPFSDVIAVE